MITLSKKKSIKLKVIMSEYINLQKIEDDRIVEGKMGMFLDESPIGIISDSDHVSSYDWEIISKSGSSSHILTSRQSEESPKIYFFKKNMDRVIEFSLNEILNYKLRGHFEEILLEEVKEFKDFQNKLKEDKIKKFYDDVDSFLKSYESFLINSVIEEIDRSKIKFTLNNLRKILKQNCYSPTETGYCDSLKDYIRNPNSIFTWFRDSRKCKYWIQKDWFKQNYKGYFEVIEKHHPELDLEKSISEGITPEWMLREFGNIENITVFDRLVISNHDTENHEVFSNDLLQFGYSRLTFDPFNELLFERFILLYRVMMKEPLEYWKNS